MYICSDRQGQRGMQQRSRARPQGCVVHSNAPLPAHNCLIYKDAVYIKRSACLRAGGSPTDAPHVTAISLISRPLLLSRIIYCSQSSLLCFSPSLFRPEAKKSNRTVRIYFLASLLPYFYLRLSKNHRNEEEQNGRRGSRTGAMTAVNNDWNLFQHGKY
jgi:hypothetical protein